MKNIFKNQTIAINFFLNLIEEVKKKTEKDLNNAKLLFIEKIEDSLPETNNTPLNELNFSEIFGDKISKEFTNIYSEMIEFYIDLNQDNLNYTFGEKVNYSKEDFTKKLEEIETKLQSIT